MLKSRSERCKVDQEDKKSFKGNEKSIGNGKSIGNNEKSIEKMKVRSKRKKSCLIILEVAHT